MKEYEKAFRVMDKFLKGKLSPSELDFLRQCRDSSPETKLKWLADALKDSHAKKRVVKKH